MIDDWAYIVGWSRGWWRANYCRLPQPCSNAQISPASFKLLATLPPMQLSWQLPLFAVTVHCWHTFNLVLILAPKVLLGKAAAQPVSFLIVLMCGVTLLYGYFLKFLPLIQKSSDMKHQPFPQFSIICKYDEDTSCIIMQMKILTTIQIPGMVL